MTKNVPDRVIAASNPAKAVKIIGDNTFGGSDVTCSNTSDPPFFPALVRGSTVHLERVDVNPRSARRGILGARDFQPNRVLSAC